MSDIVTMMNGYFKLWEVDVLGKTELVNMHKICQTHLDNNLHTSKRIMTGRMFADLVTQVGKAKEYGIYSYDVSTIQRLEQMFVLDKQKEFHFTITDLLNNLRSFEILSND